MINNSEHQLSFIEHLRGLADGLLEPREAVRSYHGALQRLKIKPYRRLDDDLQPTPRGSAYGGSPPTAAKPTAGRKRQADGVPDFSKMSQAEKLAWNQGAVETHPGLSGDCPSLLPRLFPLRQSQFVGIPAIVVV